MINLNDDSFNGGSNVSIFNNGTAGIVENVKISLKRKHIVLLYEWYILIKKVS